MRCKIIYPKWRKLAMQTHFDLPPHGPVVFAAALPDFIQIEFVDENVQELNTDDKPDIIALSIMLTAQIKRAIEIAVLYKQKGITVIAGGIAAMLHYEELAQYVDSVFVGEAEGKMDKVFDDIKNNSLSKIYNFLSELPPIESVGTARRDILNNNKYIYRSIKMLDLVHASRGCRFECFPCCTPFLGGKKFRPRPIDKVIREIESINNSRLFLVDNSLAQSYEWEESLFKALIPLKRKWVSHPIENDNYLLDLAYKAGCWYVYQAIFDTSDTIRNRVKKYHEHGIGVEGTIILGTDNQDIDYIKKLIDFLLEINLDIAEFTILTPFPHTPIRVQFENEGRIICNNWEDYTCDKVVFQPKNMTTNQLQDMYYYAWEKFYENCSQEIKMGELFRKVVKREIEDGTYRRTRI